MYQRVIQYNALQIVSKALWFLLLVHCSSKGGCYDSQIWQVVCRDIAWEYLLLFACIYILVINVFCVGS